MHFNVLVMGKHGSNVDTMIFTNVNSETREITMISIPRDLYVNGRKINSVYASYGIEEQVSWVEDVVGQQIDNYILIDMYVFRDVIDLMGGVDIMLKEDLIDPTYKTCEGDVCSTLYYAAGTYHLDGTEALRIARSRHTTSDYSRAERQQLILEGIKEKAMGLGIGDSDTLMAILSTVIDSTETDISVDAALRYYFRYQNFTLNDGYVISTGNVLSAVPVPVSYVTSHPIETCLDETKPETCTESYAIDTLAPVGGDWGLIRGYVEQILAE
ncbi:MAG: LCP family protein [Candidatus Gracilibacteria bacterium]